MNTAEARQKWGDIKVGWWYTICCEHDLCQIAADDELNGMVGDLKNPKAVFPEGFGVWETKEEALAALKDVHH
jgi:hypothetical protein